MPPVDIPEARANADVENLRVTNPDAPNEPVTIIGDIIDPDMVPKKDPKAAKHPTEYEAAYGKYCKENNDNRKGIALHFI